MRFGQHLPCELREFGIDDVDLMLERDDQLDLSEAAEFARTTMERCR